MNLAQFDRAGLVGLFGDLHNLSRDNQAFLHARLGLGADSLRYLPIDAIADSMLGYMAEHGRVRGAL